MRGWSRYYLLIISSISPGPETKLQAANLKFATAWPPMPMHRVVVTGEGREGGRQDNNPNINMNINNTRSHSFSIFRRMLFWFIDET